jgi:response regulator RpfG family c-di-GMP phosphodiesterase
MGSLNVLIIDGNDLDMRMRLKHSITSTSVFGECYHVAHSAQAIEIAQTLPSCIDLVFISYHVKQDQVREFAQAVREIEKYQDAALILILASGSTKETTLAESMLGGIDGFLLEPFSTDDLVKVSKLAGKVNREKTTTREYVAMKLLVRDQVRLLDAVYCLNRGHIETEQTFDKLKHLSARVAQFSETSLQMYYSLLIDVCERSLVPIAIPKNPYQGKSERTKKRVDQMLISNLESPKVPLDPKKEVLVGGRIMNLPPTASKNRR